MVKAKYTLVGSCITYYLYYRKTVKIKFPKWWVQFHFSDKSFKLKFWEFSDGRLRTSTVKLFWTGLIVDRHTNLMINLRNCLWWLHFTSVFCVFRMVQCSSSKNVDELRRYCNFHNDTTHAISTVIPRYFEFLLIIPYTILTSEF